MDLPNGSCVDGSPKQESRIAESEWTAQGWPTLLALVCFCQIVESRIAITAPTRTQDIRDMAFSMVMMRSTSHLVMELSSNETHYISFNICIRVPSLRMRSSYSFSPTNNPSNRSLTNRVQ